MFRALSTRKSNQGYDRLIDESPTIPLTDPKLIRSTTLPAKFFDNSSKKLAPNQPKLQPADKSLAKQVKKASKVHPLFSIFEKRSRRKKATAKPEFSRYMQYLKEGGTWDANSSKPVIY